MDASGRGVRQLTRNRQQDLTPHWSPDGRLIAFASDRARRGEPEIWVMRADGTNARRLVDTVNHPGWQDLQWSPDRRRLIFSTAGSDSNPELYVVGADGKALKRLTKTAGGPDVAFTERVVASGRTSVWVMNRDGSKPRRVTSGGEPDWRPTLARAPAALASAPASARRSRWSRPLTST